MYRHEPLAAFPCLMSTPYGSGAIPFRSANGVVPSRPPKIRDGRSRQPALMCRSAKAMSQVYALLVRFWHFQKTEPLSLQLQNVCQSQPSVEKAF